MVNCIYNQPYVFVAHRTWMELVQLFNKGRKSERLDYRNTVGETPLHAAIVNACFDIAELLIAKGADVNAKDEYGETPLYIAAHSDKDIAELLIAKGADVNARTKRGDTPLFSTALFVHKDKAIAELLIAKGADVNAENKDGETPLYIAAREGHKEVANLLIAKGADVNAKTEDN